MQCACLSCVYEERIRLWKASVLRHKKKETRDIQEVSCSLYFPRCTRQRSKIVLLNDYLDFLVCGKFMPHTISIYCFVLILAYVTVKHCDYNQLITDTIIYNRKYPFLGGITQGLVQKVVKLSSLP